ncbi:putative DNA repair and recombination protein RAD54B [Blattamonas nauphoetae]|uniref:DNA repair and recombination protein RAD54B n=1 Tax=Blattamonas nauphoetae TaxID=2049346 RepID=A0ABQ9XXP2_9EUKA|nr:putative DNA repair and recombination protein RAD54B [Blattamonas nauphoetae]
MRALQEAKAKDESTDKEYCFRVMYTQASSKVHKTYADGYLTIINKMCQLYDSEGKVIAKQGLGCKPTDLINGSSLRILNKELEIMSPMPISEVKSGAIFIGPGSRTMAKAQTAAPKFVSKFKTKKSKLEEAQRLEETEIDTSASDKISIANKRILSGTKPLQTSPQKARPLFDPTAPNAIIVNPSHPATDPKGAALVDVVIDPCLGSVLEPHQVEGVRFMFNCITGGGLNGEGGCILADEMGLGKSIQAITLIWTVLKQSAYGVPLIHRAVVVCPLSLITSWKAEFNKWLKHKLVVGYISNEKKEKENDELLSRFCDGTTLSVIVISYETLWTHIARLSKARVGLVICDEGHRLKNHKTKTAETLMQFPTQRRVLLTGTPIQNNLDEFWSMCHFVDDLALGDFTVFKRVFATPITKARDIHASKREQADAQELSEELTRRTSTFLLRRTKEVIALPQKHENIIFCRPSTVQAEIYRRVLQTKLSEAFDSSSSALLLSMFLRLLSDHPGLVAPGSRTTKKKSSKSSTDDDGLEVDEHPLELLYQSVLTDEEKATLDPSNLLCSSKMIILDSLLHHIHTMYPKEKVVISSIFTKMLNFIEELCVQRGYSFVRLDGSTSGRDRQTAITTFTSPHSTTFLFLLSAKAGGVGLNLMCANRIILFEPDWNPSTDEQTMGRVHRHGQKRTVHVYRFISTGTTEEKIIQRQLAKMGLYSTIKFGGKGGLLMGGNEGSIRRFSREDLKNLFQLRLDTRSDTIELMTKSSKDILQSPVRHVDGELFSALDEKKERERVGLEHQETDTPLQPADPKVSSTLTDVGLFDESDDSEIDEVPQKVKREESSDCEEEDKKTMRTDDSTNEQIGPGPSASPTPSPAPSDAEDGFQALLKEMEESEEEDEAQESESSSDDQPFSQPITQEAPNERNWDWSHDYTTVQEEDLVLRKVYRLHSVRSEPTNIYGRGIVQRRPLFPENADNDNFMPITAIMHKMTEGKR